MKLSALTSQQAKLPTQPKLDAQNGPQLEKIELK
jgi:hypothetical protein